MNKIHTITLPQAASGDLSNWKTALTAIGFTEVSGDNSRLRWKNSNYGIHLNGTSLYLYTFNLNSDIINPMSTVTNARKTFAYRLINNGKGIIFGISNTNASIILEKAIIYTENEEYNYFACGYDNAKISFQADWIGTGGQSLGNTYNQTYFPDSAIQLCKVWIKDHFSEDLYMTVIRPVMQNFSVLNIQVGSKTFLICNFSNTNIINAVAFDITNEEDEES